MPSVYEFVLSDRQWKRDQRIAHAKHMLTKSRTSKERDFWREVLEANEG